MKLYLIKKYGMKPFEFYARSMLCNNKGIALIMVLILSLISLAIMSGLIYMVTSGTRVSGVEKRYNTAFEAGESGIDVTYLVLAKRKNPFDPLDAAKINFQFTPSGNACLSTKLNNKTDNWLGCDSSVDIITEPAPDVNTYDMSFQLGKAPSPVYAVYSKIVDTVEGNSGVDEGLIKSGVVLSNSGEVPVMHVPYLYTFEIDAENTINPTERAKFSALYRY